MTTDVLEKASLASVRTQPCWIMLIQKLPTASSPPKLSIFWSTPWPYEPAVQAMQQIRRRMEKTGITTKLDAMAQEEFAQSPYGEYGGPVGRNPDLLNARAIRFDGETIRVWPHEFSVMTTEKMRFYVAEQGGAYTLRPEDATPGSPLVKLLQDVTLDTDQRFVRDAALVDGCTPEQATLVALGEDVLEATEFAPLGWYKLIDAEAILAYCSEQEEREDRKGSEGMDAEVGP